MLAHGVDSMNAKILDGFVYPKFLYNGHDFESNTASPDELNGSGICPRILQLILYFDLVMVQSVGNIIGAALRVAKPRFIGVYSGPNQLTPSVKYLQIVISNAECYWNPHIVYSVIVRCEAVRSIKNIAGNGNFSCRRTTASCRIDHCLRHFEKASV